MQGARRGRTPAYARELGGRDGCSQVETSFEVEAPASLARRGRALPRWLLALPACSDVPAYASHACGTRRGSPRAQSPAHAARAARRRIVERCRARPRGAPPRPGATGRAVVHREGDRTLEETAPSYAGEQWMSAVWSSSNSVGRRVRFGALRLAARSGVLLSLSRRRSTSTAIRSRRRTG